MAGPRLGVVTPNLPGIFCPLGTQISIPRCLRTGSWPSSPFVEGTTTRPFDELFPNRYMVTNPKFAENRRHGIRYDTPDRIEQWLDHHLLTCVRVMNPSPLKWDKRGWLCLWFLCMAVSAVAEWVGSIGPKSWMKAARHLQLFIMTCSCDRRSWYWSGNGHVRFRRQKTW